MTFDAIYRRIDAYLKRAREQALVVTRIPYIVMRAEWAGGKEAPDYRDMKALMAGRVPLHDYPGYEEHNAGFGGQQQQRGAIVPKLYLFDPNCDGIDDRPPDEDDELTFEEYP